MYFRAPWNATTLYLMRNFIYRKMAMLWDHVFPAHIVTLLCIDLTWRSSVTHLRSCVGKDLEMISLQYGITLYKTFISSFNLGTALMHLVRSNLQSIVNDPVLEFLDLSLHINKHSKICVDVYAKPTNSFTCVLPSVCYPKKNIKFLKGLH